MMSTISERILDLAATLIAVESIAERPLDLDRIVDLVAERFSGGNWHVTRFPETGAPAIYIGTQPGKRADYMLNGHLDVVPGLGDQFTPRLSDAYLIGRGSVDMKLFDAVALVALEEIAQRYPDLNAGIYLSTDEERGGQRGAKRFVEAGWGARLLVNGDAGVDHALVTGSKGILRFDMTARSQPGRMAYPWEGRNAVEILLDACQRLRERFPDKDRATAEDNWYSTYSLGDIHSVSEPSCPPHEAHARFGVNFIDDLSYDELFMELQALVPEVELQMVNVAERLDVDDSHPLYADFCSLMGRHFQHPIQRRKDNGSSDAKYFRDAMDHILIVKMPGEGAHEPDERARLDAIEPMYHTLLDFAGYTLDLVSRHTFKETIHV